MLMESQIAQALNVLLEKLGFLHSQRKTKECIITFMRWTEHYLTSECDGCGEDLQVESLNVKDPEQTLSGYVQVERGWCLDLTGHYGGFTDDMEESRLRHVSLCHACCLKIARMLPNLFTEKNGNHSMDYRLLQENNNSSCCEFAWGIDDHGCTVVGDGAGGWIERVSPAGDLIGDA